MAFLRIWSFRFCSNFHNKVLCENVCDCFESSKHWQFYKTNMNWYINDENLKIRLFSCNVPLTLFSWCTSFWFRKAGYLLIRRFSKYLLILHNCECKILKWGLRHLEGSWLWKKSKCYRIEPASIYFSGSGLDMWKCYGVWSSVTLCPPISLNKWV